MPSQESDMVNSSHHMEVGSASHGSWQCIPISQAPSQATPPIPETVQRRPYPNRQQKQKKNKPKSIQEFVQDMHKQNCVLMEKKLEVQQFLREQSKKLFALEYRRLDLEFMRMEQQRLHLEKQHLDLKFMRMKQQHEDSRIHELALQVELE